MDVDTTRCASTQGHQACVCAIEMYDADTFGGGGCPLTSGTYEKRVWLLDSLESRRVRYVHITSTPCTSSSPSRHACTSRNPSLSPWQPITLREITRNLMRIRSCIMPVT